MKLLPIQISSSSSIAHQPGHAINTDRFCSSSSPTPSSNSSSPSSSPLTNSVHSSSNHSNNNNNNNNINNHHQQHHSSHNSLGIPMEQHRLPLFNHSDFIWRYGPLTFSSLPPTYPTLDFKNHLPGNLACDPRLWNKEDVLSFLRWCEVEFDLPRFDMDMFQMNGKALCLLTKQDLGERCPGAGDLIHNILRWLIRDGSSPAHLQPHSPVTPHFPITPSWCVPLSGSGVTNQDFSHTAPTSTVTVHHNSVTLSPAPSVDSQSGSPKQLDHSIPSAFSLITNAYNRNGVANGAASSGSNQSDSEADESSEVVHSPGPISLTSTASSPPYSPRSLPKSASSTNTSGQIFFPPTPSENASSTEPNTNGRLLWDFLQQLLNDSMQRYTNYITWKNRESGVFKIVDPPGLAKLWGIQKNHLSMNYDKMSRALRYYYRVNILRKVQGERHCYQFLRNPSELKSIKNISLLRQQVISSNTTSSATIAGNLQTVSVKNEPIDDQTEEDIGPTDLSMNQNSNSNNSCNGGRLQHRPNNNNGQLCTTVNGCKDDGSDDNDKFQYPQDLSVSQLHLQVSAADARVPDNYTRQLIDGGRNMSHSPSPLGQITVKMEDTS